MAPRLSTILLIAAAVLVLCALIAVPAEAAKPSCDSCTKAGYPYLCKATLQSGACFQNAGDATCDGSGCTCCKKVAGPGCQSCDEADDDDEDAMDDTD